MLTISVHVKCILHKILRQLLVAFLPAVQGLQSVTLLFPVALEKVPIGHCVGVPDPSLQ